MSTEMRREKEERAPREQIQVRGGEEARKSELLMMMPFIVARKFGGYKPDGFFFYSRPDSRHDKFVTVCGLVKLVLLAYKPILTAIPVNAI